MCARCGTGRVAWCTSPDNHASDPGWDAARESRFCELIGESLTGFMHPEDSRELSALKAARDKARAEGMAKNPWPGLSQASTRRWLRTLRREQLCQLICELAGSDPYIMRALTTARELAERQ